MSEKQEHEESLRHETVILDASQIPLPPRDTRGNIVLIIIAIAGLLGIAMFLFM